MTLFAKVLILFVVVCLPEIRTELGEPEVSRNNDKTVTNSSNTSTICHFHISKSSRKSVLKLMQNSKTNAMKLNLWIKSVNDTMTLMNKNRLPTDMLWVNELGRTLYSLKLETNWYTRNALISYLPEVTLTAGFRDVDIVVSEENEGCLLSRNNTMDHVIFDILLFQLYRVSDVKNDYQFCHTYNRALNCCRIFPGDKNIRICSHYSSLFLPYYNFYSTLSFFVLYIAFCLIVDFFSRFKANGRDSTTYINVSNSPMALSYIFYEIFIKGQSEGQIRIKSFGRKLLVVAFVVVIYAPVRNFDLNFIISSPWRIAWYAFLGVWALIFLFFDLHGSSKSGKSIKSLEDIGSDMLKITAYPFNLHLFWKNVTTKWDIFDEYLCLNLTSKEKYILLENINADTPQYTDCGHGNDEEYSDGKLHPPQHFRLKTILKYFISIFILILFYLVFFLPLSLLFTALKWCKHIYFLFRGISLSKCVFSCIFFVSVIGLLTSCFMYFFGLTMLFIIGLFLNGEIFINSFLPLSTILFYSWTNWKSSVETKYLVLNTCIYEVCKESTTQSNSTESNAVPNSEEELIYFIKLNDDREPIIDKGLFHLVRKEFLPYHQVLFYYFMGMFFVAVFAHFLYTMMSLSEKSGITNIIHIIGSMAATALPIIFNLVWKHSSDEQKDANVIALKAKLRRFLTIRCLNKENEEFEVKVTKQINQEKDQQSSNELDHSSLFPPEDKRDWPNLSNHNDLWKEILTEVKKLLGSHKSKTDTQNERSRLLI